jgi:peptidyl-prolyl cis-trans isomerase D
MTMLDRMRRHRNWLKWSLGIVVLAMVIFFIPNFFQNPLADAVNNPGNVAVVQGHEISADEYRRTYQAQIQAYRNAYGAAMNDRLLKQLGVDQQILMQMVDERAALAEAERLQIGATDEEVKQRILTIPAFQENGHFIGEQRYQQLLAMQRPPLSASDFEQSMRSSIIVEKLRSAVTEWLSIDDKEVDQEYRRRNDKVKLAVVALRADNFKPDVSASDAELSAYFDTHQDEFKMGEKRKIKYALIDGEAMRAKITITPADLERAYNDNFEQYSTPEQIRASHILLRTEGKDEATVRAAAEDVLKQAKAGADFAGLAKKYSEDEGTKDKGGDLDFFGRGRMVPEFDQAAFALEPGQTSDLVKTQYGFHIIKLVEKKGGITKTLDEVRPQLTETLTSERTQQEVETLATRLGAQITKPADLDAVGRANGLAVQETALFARDEPLMTLGGSPEVAARAFQLKDGEVSGPVPTSRGVVFMTLTGRQDAYVPKIDEVKDKVRDVVLTQKARDLAKQKASELAAKVKGAPDFEKAAKAAGYEARTTELITRESPIPELGMAPVVNEAAFALPQGGVSDVIATDSGAAVVKVLEKQEVGTTEMTANRDQFRQELLNDRRGRFFSAYMVKAKQKMKIEVNREAVQRVLGS